jgi:hypothetical protein
MKHGRTQRCAHVLFGCTLLRRFGISLLWPASAGGRRLGLRLRFSDCCLIAPDLAEAKALGEFGALRGVIGRDHRVVGRHRFRRGAMSTPSASGSTVSRGFFFAFMMLGSEA